MANLWLIYRFKMVIFQSDMLVYHGVPLVNHYFYSVLYAIVIITNHYSNQKCYHYPLYSTITRLVITLMVNPIQSLEKPPLNHHSTSIKSPFSYGLAIVRDGFYSAATFSTDPPGSHLLLLQQKAFNLLHVAASLFSRRRFGAHGCVVNDVKGMYPQVTSFVGGIIPKYIGGVLALGTSAFYDMTWHDISNGTLMMFNCIGNNQNIFVIWHWHDMTGYSFYYDSRRSQWNTSDTYIYIYVHYYIHTF